MCSLVDVAKCPGHRRIDNYLTVHSREADHADVTEGSAGVWERLQYDWSDPHRIVMTTTDSNVWGGASGVPAP